VVALLPLASSFANSSGTEEAELAIDAELETEEEGEEQGSLELFPPEISLDDFLTPDQESNLQSTEGEEPEEAPGEEEGQSQSAQSPSGGTVGALGVITTQSDPYEIIDGNSNTTITSANSGTVYQVFTGSGDKIITIQNATCTLILMGTQRTAPESTLRILGNSNVAIYLPEGTSSSFTTSALGAQYTYSPGIIVQSPSTLTIYGPGSLSAVGRERGAGIGGGRDWANNNPITCGNINIMSGTVVAQGGQFAAGIGGGYTLNGGTVVLDGGNVTATGGIEGQNQGGGAGIGGGAQGNGGTVTINGGTVTATGGTGGGAGIGGGGSSGTFTGGGVGATVTINNGTVTARGGVGGGSGIGGGRHREGGITTIYGGTIAAHGSPNASPNGSGAGIGGGGGPTGGISQSGTIKIYGGNITARAYGSASAIGGGYNSPANLIEIHGGIVDAEAANAGTGIGAGGGASCGDIIITGGHIRAKGANLAAGIGSGLGRDSTGTIMISGGIIYAQSSNYLSSGVGGGDGSRVTVNISGGSVNSLTSTDMIRVNFDPTNGPTHGDRLVYLIGVEVKNENELLPNTDISIIVAGGGGASDYVYHATTNSSAKAYLWLPEGTHDFLMYNPEDGTYLDYSMKVEKPVNPEVYNPATNTGSIVLASGSPQWSLALSNPNTKKYDSQTLTLNINHNNIPTGTDKKKIIDVSWYRENVGTSQNTQATFEAGYNAALNENRGSGGTANDLELALQVGYTKDVHQYLMNIDRNGRYWIQIHYEGANTGMDVYHVTHIDVCNIYTPVSVYVKDLNTRRGALTDYVKLTLPGNATYGIPYDLDGITVLDAAHALLGYDELTYLRNDSMDTTYWNMVVPGAPFAPTAMNAASALITLDTTVDESADPVPENSFNKKYYTVLYGLADIWHVVTTYFVDQDGLAIDGQDQVEYFAEKGQPFVLSDRNPLPIIADYTFENWRIAPDGALQNSNDVTVADVQDDVHINLIYYSQSTLTISHSVLGHYSDSRKEFDYTLHITNSYDALPADDPMFYVIYTKVPTYGMTVHADGELVLDEFGTTSFKLKHGESIEIHGVSLGSKVRIVMEDDRNYDPSFKDSVESYSEEGFDTGGETGAYRSMSVERVFDFSNERKHVVTTDFHIGNFELFLLMILSAFVTLLVILIEIRLRRSKKGQAH